MYVRIGKAATLLGVAKSTLRRWEKEKKLIADYRTQGGHRRYSMIRLLQIIRQLPVTKEKIKTTADTRPQVVTYARVSGSKQREDLKRQQEHLKGYVKTQGWHLVNQYQDIGSGLNDNRQGLIRLIKELPIIQPAMIVCSYQDRLARFGLTLLQTICAIFNTKIVVTHESVHKKSLEEQLVKDVLAILTSFAGKLHRARRGK
jgi:predicted site-specific integrase-resolvase